MKREDTQNVQAVTHGNVTLKVYEVNRGNRTVFSVAHKQDGRRQLKQFGELAAALTWASNRAKEIDRGKTPCVMLAPDEGATYRRAMEILRGIGKPLDLVAREYVDAVDTLGGAARLDDAATFYAERRLRLVQRTVPEVVEELLEARAHRSERHVRDLKHRLRRFSGDVTGFIGNVTQRDISMWLAKLGLAPRSHDNFRQAIVLLFRFAQKRGYLPEGKTAAEKTELMGDAGEGDIAIFTPDEIRRLLNAAGNEVLPYLALGAFAGIRTAEIVRLDWSEINFETGYIEIKKSKAKTKGRRLIKMQPNLVAWLRKAGTTAGPVSTLARPEKHAAEVVAAKLEPAIEWKRNGLRHSYASYAMAVVQNEHEVSGQMGNSAAMLYANYRALATKEQGEEWFSIMPEKE